VAAERIELSLTDWLGRVEDFFKVTLHEKERPTTCIEFLKLSTSWSLSLRKLAVCQ